MAGNVQVELHYFLLIMYIFSLRHYLQVTDRLRVRGQVEKMISTSFSFFSFVDDVSKTFIC